MESVQEGPWNNLSLGKKVALAIGISAGATVGYIVYRRIRSGAAVTKASYQKTEEIRVSLPLEAYRSISRCHATFLDVVNQNSGAQVNILPDIMNQTTVTFLLRGFPDQVTVAKCALDKLVFDCEVINEVVKVPKTAFGRIIGRGGETIKLISRTSGARVNCMKDLRSILEQKGKVSIIGTRREVQTAKEMIMEKVTEDQVVRKRICQASSQRQKRKQLENGDGLGPSSLDGQAVEMPLQVVEGPGNGKIDDVEHPEPSLDEVEEKEAASPPSEFSTFEIPSPDLSFQPDEHLEVYVSASENPEHFFIQILGVRSLQLDKLTAEMSRFYSNNTSREHRVLTIVVGDIVAAPYRECETWNRARVLGVLPSGLVDLYYVDFGDNGAFPQSNLRSMRSDFLSLPFQAIECSLAGISPAGNSWTEAALDDFDRLTYCAEWKPLLAKLCSYSHSEDSFWPSIKLFDNSQGTNTDVGEEMIRLGHAVPCKDYGGILPDDPLSLQRMLADMTSATSELSLSCISLSGSGPVLSEDWASNCSLSSVEVQRADVETSPSCMFSPSSLHQSTPSQNLTELIRHTMGSPHQSIIEPHEVPTSSAISSSPSASSLHLKPAVLSNTISTFSTSSSCEEVLSSALDSLSLTNEVFLEGLGCGHSSCYSSEDLSSEDKSSSRVHAGSTEGESDVGSSSGGIRSVWYYLSSQDEHSQSLSTTIPMSSSCSGCDETENGNGTSSASVLDLSTDDSDCIKDIQGPAAEQPSARLRGFKETGPVIEVDSSSSSDSSDLIYLGQESHMPCSDADLHVNPEPKQLQVEPSTPERHRNARKEETNQLQQAYAEGENTRFSSRPSLTKAACLMELSGSRQPPALHKRATKELRGPDPGVSFQKNDHAVGFSDLSKATGERNSMKRTLHPMSPSHLLCQIHEEAASTSESVDDALEDELI